MNSFRWVSSRQIALVLAIGVVFGFAMIFTRGQDAQGQQPKSEMERMPIFDSNSSEWNGYYEKGVSKSEVSLETDPDNKGKTAIRINYDVTKEDSYSGFYLKFNVPAFQPAEWSVISFSVRGTANERTPQAVKVELKILEDKWGWRTLYIGNLTGKWKQERLHIKDFKKFGEWKQEKNKEKKENEFVLTFENKRAVNKVGTIYLRDIAFEK
jgi:hypothetical protein